MPLVRMVCKNRNSFSTFFVSNAVMTADLPSSTVGRRPGKPSWLTCLSGLALAQTDQANTTTTAKSHKRSMQQRMGMSHTASHKGKLYGSTRLPSKSQPQGALVSAAHRYVRS